MLNISELTSTELVDAYNLCQNLLGKTLDSHISKFRDLKTGVSRVTKSKDELTNMYGYASLEKSETNRIIWITEKPLNSVKSTVSSNLKLDEELTVLVDINPKRPTSRAHSTFLLYSVSKTGSEFIQKMLEAGYDRKLALSTLHWDIEHGYISLGEQDHIDPTEDTEAKQPV